MHINDLKTFIEEVINNPEGVQSVDEVMETSLRMYRELSEMFVQATPTERERIAETLLEISELFEAKFTDQARKMGKTKEELIEAMQDPENYTPEVWASVKNFQSKVDEEKRSLKAEVLDKKPKRARIRNTLPRTFA